MNDQLEKSLASLVDAARQSGSDLATFVQQQAPDVCQQIIAWQFWFGALTAILCAIALLGVALGIWRAWKTEDEGHYIPATIVGLMLSLFLCIGLYINTARAVKAKVAPKLVLLEQISRTLSGGGK